MGYKLSEQLDLEAEGRYSKDKREVNTNRFDRTTDLPITTGARLITRAESSPDAAIFNLTAGYKPTSLWLVYGKVGTGVRSGGFNTAAGDPRQPVAIPPDFGDETSTTFEVGAKGNITPNIYVTAAAYRTTIKDFLVQQDNGCLATNPVCPVASASFLINGGKAEIYGVEADVSMRFQLFDGPLRINANGARQKGEVIAGRFKGATTPQTPVWNGSLNIDYRHDLAGGFRGFANVTYSFQKGGIRVPTIFRWDERLPRGKVVNTTGISFDITATALKAGGALPKAGLDGVDLAPFLTGVKTGPAHPALFWRSGSQGAVRSSDWKLVRTGEKLRLFNLKSDLGERNDLAATQPKKAAALNAQWRTWSAQMQAPAWVRNELSGGDPPNETRIEATIDRFVRGERPDLTVPE